MLRRSHPTTIPQDVVNIIVDALPRRSNGDHSALVDMKAASSVCKAFVPPCRQHLFASLSLCPLNSSHLFRYNLFLAHNPYIAPYIRNLNICIEDFMASTTENIMKWSLESPPRDNYFYLAEIVRKLPNLHALSIKHVDWSSLSHTLQDALFSVFTSSSLRELSLSWSTNIPTSLFRHFARINTLTLTSTHIDHSEPHKPLTSHLITEQDNTRLQRLHLVDTSNSCIQPLLLAGIPAITHLKVYPHTFDDIHPLHALMTAASGTLEHLEWSIDGVGIYPTLVINLATMPNIRSLRLLNGTSPPAVVGPQVLSLLSTASTGNHIQSVRLAVPLRCHYRDDHYVCDGWACMVEMCKELDTCLSRARFSGLKSMYIDILFACYGEDNDPTTSLTAFAEDIRAAMPILNTKCVVGIEIQRKIEEDDDEPDAEEKFGYEDDSSFD